MEDCEERRTSTLVYLFPLAKWTTCFQGVQEVRRGRFVRSTDDGANAAELGMRLGDDLEEVKICGLLTGFPGSSGQSF